MVKLNLIMVVGLILLLSGMAFAEIYKGMPIDTIDTSKPGEIKPIEDIEPAEIEKETYVELDNSAYTKTKDSIVTIDKFMAKPNEKISLHVEAAETKNSLCLDFPVDNSKIMIKEIKVNVPFWFDKNLKPYESRSKNQICYKGINIKNEDIYFQPVYLGEGLLKYNVTFGDLNLDPYIVGVLNHSNYLTAYFPYNGNINAVFASVPSILNSSTLRLISTASAGSYDGSMTNPTYGYDGNYGTSASTNGYNSGNIYLSYSKTAADTGIVLQYKCFGGGTYGTGTKTANITTPSECFNGQTDQVSYLVSLSRSLCGSFCDQAHVYLYCYDGSSYQYQEEICTGNNGGNSVDAGFYESSAYITNQSQFVAYNTTLPVAEYIDRQNLSNGYPFGIMQNPFDVSILHLDATVFGANLTGQGYRFDGVSSYMTIP